MRLVRSCYDAMESESAPINREEAVQRLEALRQQVRRRLAEVEGV